MNYVIRPAVPADVPALPGIERAAGQRFRAYPDLGIPESMFDEPNDEETFMAAQQAGHLWVAVALNGALLGFALVRDVGSYAHLEEIDVLPAYGSMGIGAALLATVCAWSAAAGHPAVTLRTFRQVPWNAPFYAKQGFQVVDAASLSGAHVALEAHELARGLRTDIRVTMINRTKA